ncbi:Fic family protein, partial [Staphylococcus aureus]
MFFLNATERMINSILKKIEKSEELYRKGVALLKNESEIKLWY